MFSSLTKKISSKTVNSFNQFFNVKNTKGLLSSVFNLYQSKFTQSNSINKHFRRGFSTFSQQSQDLIKEEQAQLELEIMKGIDPTKIRNVAIIAHVDHGKTTLVDCMLSQGGIDITGNERAMDSNELEQERGITILSKCTAIQYKGIKINIVDTPGHQDFGGEVERIMSMVDSVCLVVCASEGPMPQTRYVLQKALSQGLRPIVVINKVDRDTARLQEVENEIFDLFVSLDATEQQMNYPLIYASAKNGWSSLSAPTYDNKKPGDNIFPLLDSICSYVPHPNVDLTKDFTMLVSQIESNNYFGKMLIGRIHTGKIEVGQKVSAVDQDGKVIDSAKVFKLVRRFGTKQIELTRAGAGDIILLAGLPNGTVTHTINSFGGTKIIPSIAIDPPMISVQVKTNDSPYYGRDGDKYTYQQLKDRLIKEGENDVSLRVEFDPKKKDCINLFGRGDLHLGIIIEKMRREGFEMTLNPPQVIYKTEKINGKMVKLEPIEQLTIEVKDEFLDFLIEVAMNRHGEITDTIELKDSRMRVTMELPTRGMFGLRSKLVNMTKGEAIITSKLKGYEEFKGPIKRVTKGAIVSMTKGKCTQYALKDAENHGELFVFPGYEVYEGMVIGELNKDGGEIELSPIREKAVTNVRTVLKEENIKLQPHRSFTIEDAMVMLRGDELLEVTPKYLRIRKTVLDNALRRKMKREKRIDENL